MNEEIFGPVWPVKTYKTMDEVIEYVNDHEKPLSVYYFGNKNSKNAKRVNDETSSGAFVTNECIV